MNRLHVPSWFWAVVTGNYRGPDHAECAFGNSTIFAVQHDHDDDKAVIWDRETDRITVCSLFQAVEHLSLQAGGLSDEGPDEELAAYFDTLASLTAAERFYDALKLPVPEEKEVAR